MTADGPYIAIKYKPRYRNRPPFTVRRSPKKIPSQPNPSSNFIDYPYKDQIDLIQYGINNDPYLYGYKQTSVNLPLKKSVVPFQTDEQKLIKALRMSDRKAQNFFYQKYFGKMFGIAFRYASNKEDAYEIINSAFLKVFASVVNYREMGSFEGWIATIVKRTALDHCKKYDFKKGVEKKWRPADPPTYNAALGQLAAEDLFKLIQKVPPASRTVFNCFVFDGLSHPEIAEKLNISVGTSKWHLSNARKILIGILKKE